MENGVDNGFIGTTSAGGALNKKLLVGLVAALFAVIGIITLLSTSAGQVVNIDPSLPQPTNFRSFADDHTVTLAWEPVDDSRVIGYYVTWREQGSNDTPGALQTAYSTIQVQPLVNGTNYEFTVQSAEGTIVTYDGGINQYEGEDNEWGRASGNVSQAATTTGSPTGVEVAAQRSRLTGFFDDFNIPKGPMDELKWNHASSSCTTPGASAAFINPQFHAHNSVKSFFCDRAGLATRPRATLNTAGATEQNPAQIEFAIDGAVQPRDTWYFDIIPTTARANGRPLDITSHDSAFDNDTKDPGRMLRINQLPGGINMSYYLDDRNQDLIENGEWGDWNLDITRPDMPCGQTYHGPKHISMYRCDMTRKTPGLSTVPQLDTPLEPVIPNVRRHWVVQMYGTTIKVFIDSVLIMEAQMPAEFAGEQEYTVHSTIFSYNTGKGTLDDHPLPYLQFFHWDNFGFTGPAPTEVIHNYTEGGVDGETPAFGIAQGASANQERLPAGNRSTTIPVPDQIGNLVDDTARLYFTIGAFNYGGYDWVPGDHVLFNGNRYDLPDLTQTVRHWIDSPHLIATLSAPHSLSLDIAASDVLTGINQLEFHIDGVRGSRTAFFNVHLELPYAVNDPSIPSYTQPVEIYGNVYNGLVQPQLTNCDVYVFIQQDLGLNYPDGRDNLEAGPCFLLPPNAAHSGEPAGPGTGGEPDETKPTVTITAPSGNTTLPANATEFIALATASDNVGVESVEFEVNGSTVSHVAASPYQATIATEGWSAGDYAIIATARDAAGNFESSQTIMVIVPPSSDNAAPSLTVAVPTQGQEFTGEQTSFNAQVTASDSVGVYRVDFYIDNALVSADSTAPYEVPIDLVSLAAGSHTLRVVAHDSAGNASETQQSFTIAQRIVDPNPSDTTNPTLSITSPTPNLTTGQGVLPVTVSAQDNTAVAEARIYVDGTLIIVDTASPYTATVNTSAMVGGQHTIRAVARDAAGNEAITTLNFVVDESAAPSSGSNPNSDPHPAPLALPSPTGTCILGDIDCSGVVNVIDLSRLLSNFNESVTENTGGDFDGNGVVNIFDLATLLANYNRRAN